jgi:hypothetical protein
MGKEAVSYHSLKIEYMKYAPLEPWETCSIEVRRNL